MKNFFQKAFRFDQIAESHSFDGDFPEFTIRQATPADRRKRAQTLEDLKASCSAFAIQGPNFVGNKAFLHLTEYEKDTPPGDQSTTKMVNKRLDWAIRCLGEKIPKIEVKLLLVSCNVTQKQTEDQIIPIEKGRVAKGKWNLSKQEFEQIYQQLLKMNPAWRGEKGRIAKLLRQEVGAWKKAQKSANTKPSKRLKQDMSALNPKKSELISSQGDKTFDCIGSATMPRPIQKEFHLGTNDSDPTLVTIREATSEENASRQAYLLNLSKQTKDNTRFIKDGYRNTPYAFTYEPRVQDEEYIDDAYNRFSWVKEGIKDRIVSFENTLTLAACNIQQPWNQGPAFKFTNGHVDGPLIGLSNETMDEIHQKVLEMNPAWAGGLEALLSPLMENPQLNQRRGNFKDLALTSIFSESKTYLNRLMQEVSTDVFNNMGSIRVNVSTEVLGGNKRELLWALKNVNPPLGNVILYYSPMPTNTKNSYIGILEHGNFEIRVVARRDKFNYWDTDLDGVINTLRTAIQWWKTSAVYSAYEIEAMAEAANDEWVRKEGEAFLSEMEDYGYGDDD